MKKFFISVILLFAVSAFAVEDLQYVEQVPGMTKDQMYSNVIIWISQNFNSANDVIQHKSKEEGKIICRGIGSFYQALGTRRYRYTLTVDVKDGKLRLTFTNFNNVGKDVKISWKPTWKKVVKNVEDLKSRLVSGVKTAQKADDDW